MKLKYMLLLLMTFCAWDNINAQIQDWLWAKNAGSSGDEEGYGTAIDASGNLYVTGRFYSPTITFEATTLTNAGLGDVFITKYNPDGSVAWSKSAGGAGDDGGYSIACD